MLKLQRDLERNLPQLRGLSRPSAWPSQLPQKHTFPLPAVNLVHEAGLRMGEGSLDDFYRIGGDAQGGQTAFHEGDVVLDVANRGVEHYRDVKPLGDARYHVLHR